MFKLKDDVWINPDMISQISVTRDPHEIRVYTQEDQASYYIVKVGSHEAGIREAEQLAEAIEAQSTRGRLATVLHAILDLEMGMRG